MAARLLCDRGLRVEIDGGGERTLLVVTDGETVRFWTETDLMEESLRGTPVQLSALEGYCRVEVVADVATLSFGLNGGGAKTCLLPAAELRDALAWVRSLGDPHEPAG